MHMADALISPAVGGALWAASSGWMAYCARIVTRTLRDDLVPTMGILGAFIFTAQMVNFGLPGTGSSGHLGGGLLLAILLGPHAAFLVIASVLTVQAFFFADGGLLALGCNLFNLGFFPAFVAYPLVYRPLAGDRHGTRRARAAAILAAVVALQLGAFSVVVETSASGISQLPFRTFLLAMLPIHLAIGIAEGLATAAVVSFVARMRPASLPQVSVPEPPPVSEFPLPLRERVRVRGLVAESFPLKPLLAVFAVAAVAAAVVLSRFASPKPDGLEWSLARVTGKEEVPSPESALHARLAAVQAATAIFPDYSFKSAPASTAAKPGAAAPGLIGGLLTLALAALAGRALQTRQTPSTFASTSAGMDNRSREKANEP